MLAVTSLRPVVIPKSTQQAARSSPGSGTFELFLVALLYDRICLKTDVFTINYCLNILFIICFFNTETSRLFSETAKQLPLKRNI